MSQPKNGTIDLPPNGINAMSIHVAPQPMPVSIRQMTLDALRLCRPGQWVKNIFVLVPVVFSGRVTEIAAVRAGAVAFACFCLWSSAVYSLNDVLDAQSDRRHPRKRIRPVASGRIQPVVALGLAFGLTLAAAGTAFATLPVSFLMIGGLYLANSVLYGLLLKHRVIIDVLSISVGFVLRLLAGCAAIGVAPTSWILVCGFSLAMLLGFGKRRLEMLALSDPTEYRPSLQSYSAEKLNILLGITASTCLLSYMLYTVSPDTVRLHQTTRLVYTVPFVAYGIFRYIFKVQEGGRDGPVEVLVKDPVFALNGLLWLLAVVSVLYVVKPLFPEAL
jgi:4-hydroxybenzoate polyprenyltransferase